MELSKGFNFFVAILSSHYFHVYDKRYVLEISFSNLVTAHTEPFLWQNRDATCNRQRPTVYKDGFRIIIFTLQIVPTTRQNHYFIWYGCEDKKHLSKEGSETILQLFLMWFEPENQEHLSILQTPLVTLYFNNINPQNQNMR